jgi:hypothetical protein
MNGFTYLIFIGALAQFLGALSYIKETIAGRTKPNKVTWLLWAIAPMIGTFAAISSGVSWAILPVFMAGFSPLLVFIVSFWNKKSYWKLSKIDYGCGILSVLALILWAITKQPLVAISFAIMSDGLAALPTVIKTWKQPETEHPTIFAATVFSSILGIIIAKSIRFEEIGFQIYLIFICTLLVFLIYRKQIRAWRIKQLKY